MRKSKRLKQKRLKAIQAYHESKRKHDPILKKEAYKLWDEVAKERKEEN